MCITNISEAMWILNSSSSGAMRTRVSTCVSEQIGTQKNSKKGMLISMVIKVKNGEVTWRFYRNAYRKARWRRAGTRYLKEMLELMKEYGTTSGMIIF